MPEHPLGQTLIVTSGCGWMHQAGGPVQEIRPGDVVWFPPEVKHWHGATSTSRMSHVAIAEAQDGISTVWMEHATDEHYAQGSRVQGRCGT
ncbi:cupin domain-containing protein [Belnapia rosea]|uniref:cupin domain-containing protein n=1 Tax=Belnapia rosea TaxID=938405 RepID=UPI000887B6ED|nr:cupin domain-containing protein [Belnapia rosea]SDB74599.1 Cupin domain-containing protein [Belnapia rosea]